MRWYRVLPLFVFAACELEMSPLEPGPALQPGYQDVVRTVQEEEFAERYELEAPSTYRFSAPVPGRVARWHWEPQDDGRRHSPGYRHGWCVEFHVRPRYEGYPEQPESRRMAFFGDGELRGIFTPGGNNAPLELDAWSPMWVGPDWPDPRRAK